MKTVFFLLPLLGTTTAHAQSLKPQRTEPVYVMAGERVVGQLELDTLQRSKLMDIETLYEAELNALEANDTISDAAMNERAKQLNDSRTAGIKSVLTDDQFRRWQAMVEAESAAP